MLILHIIATLDPQAGGPSNSIRRIVSSYPSIGSAGEVLTLDDPNASFLTGLPFKVQALGPVSTRYGYTPRLIPWLRAERHRFDGVVIHGLWQYIGLAVRRAIYPHLPYLVFTHGMLDPWFKRTYRFKHLKKSAYWLLNESWVLRRAHRVLFTSEAESRLATESFWPSHWNSSVVPYGSSAPQGDPGALRKSFLDAHPALAQPSGAPRPFLLFLGRIHSKKGCDLLLDAFARIAEDAPDLQLVFAGPDGSGPAASASPALRQKLVERSIAQGIASRVHWTGMLYGDQKWGALYACEAFTLPSHQENFGIAVAEALACGKPVLISDKVNIWEEILSDQAAFVGPDNAAGTLRTLEQWIALTPAQKISMAASAVDCFHRRYNMKADASGIVEIFSQAHPTPSDLPTLPAKANVTAF